MIWGLSTGGRWIDVIPTMSFPRLLDPPRAPLEPRAWGVPSREYAGTLPQELGRSASAGAAPYGGETDSQLQFMLMNMVVFTQSDEIIQRVRTSF